jgi:hypothetical protein
VRARLRVGVWLETCRTVSCTRYEQSTWQVREVLERFLDDDEDMHKLNLTANAERDEHTVMMTADHGAGGGGPGTFGTLVQVAPPGTLMQTQDAVGAPAPSGAGGSLGLAHAPGPGSRLGAGSAGGGVRRSSLGPAPLPPARGLPSRGPVHPLANAAAAPRAASAAAGSHAGVGGLGSGMAAGLGLGQEPSSGVGVPPPRVSFAVAIPQFPTTVHAAGNSNSRGPYLHHQIRRNGSSSSSSSSSSASSASTDSSVVESEVAEVEMLLEVRHLGCGRLPALVAFCLWHLQLL